MSGARSSPPMSCDLASHVDVTSQHPVDGLDRVGETLFVPTDDVGTWPLTVSARLRFRAVPPFLLRLVGLGDRAGDVPIHDLATATAQVDRR